MKRLVTTTWWQDAPRTIDAAKRRRRDLAFRAPLARPIPAAKEAVADFLRRVVKDSTREQAVAIYFGPKNRPLGWRTISIDTDTMTLVKPLLVLQPAVLLGANGLIFAHYVPRNIMGVMFPDSLCALLA